jgi:hypothetical protein
VTEELDCTKRRCAICGRADLPAYNFVQGVAACCFQCVTALAAREMQRLQPKQDTK